MKLLTTSYDSSHEKPFDNCVLCRSGDWPKITAITAYALEGSWETCLEAGMDDHTVKPVEINDLRAVLERNFIGGKNTER